MLLAIMHSIAHLSIVMSQRVIPLLFLGVSLAL